MLYASANIILHSRGSENIVIAEDEVLNGIYSNVTERNSEKLENIVEYGDKYCTNYVSAKNDLEVHKAVLEKIRVLSNVLCDGTEDDYEKVRKIAYWVAGNVYYNDVAAHTSVTAETVSLETVLETKTATCAGYSNLFSALCNMQDIYCINMREVLTLLWTRTSIFSAYRQIMSGQQLCLTVSGFLLM